MKKLFLRTALLCLLCCGTQHLYAQATFTADLEMIFRDGTNNFVLNPYDSLDVGFSVVNHGPDDIDTSNYVVFGITGLPPNLFLIVQNMDGDLVPIHHNDTVDSRGIRFTHDGNFARDTTFDYCFYFKNNDYPDSFIYDSKPLNDTLCFSVTFKGNGDSVTSIANRKAEAKPLQIAPNPAKDRVNIPLNDFRNQAALLKIYSIDGRLIHIQNRTAGSAENIQVDVSNWHKGMYLVELQSDTQKRRGRFVVQ